MSGFFKLLFQLRPSPGSTDSAYRHAVLIDANGSRREIASAEVELEAIRYRPVAGRELPLAWRIGLPTIGRELLVEALHPEQWMDVDFPYWEGAVRVRGGDEGSRGVGYMELTGYPPGDR